jgi:hypothetical protein
VTKVRELRGRLTLDPELFDRDADEQLRLEHYQESLLMLEAVNAEHPQVRQLRFELEALRGLPPGPGGLSPAPGGDRL